MTERMKLEFTVGAIAHQGKVLLDGVDISNNVSAITFRAGVDEATTAELTLVCIDAIVNGEAIVNGVTVPVPALNGQAEDVTAIGSEHRLYRRRDVA